MFFNNDAFNQSLSSWDINQVTAFNGFMQNAAGLSTANYDALLIAWDAQGAMSFSGTVNFGGSKYTSGGAGDLSGEAAMFDLGLPKESGGLKDEFGNLNYPTKRNFDSPQAIEVSKQIGLLPEDPDDNGNNDDNGNKGSKFDKQADLKTIYEDLLPMMKETLDDPDDKRRQ